MFKNLSKRNAEYSVEKISNGHVVTCGGSNYDDEWVTEKVFVPTFDDLMDLLKQLDEMPLG